MAFKHLFNGKTACVAMLLLAAAGPAYGHVRLIAPNGGEELVVGSVFTVSWTVRISHNTQNWDLWYSTSGVNGPWIVIAEDLAPGNTSVGSVHEYEWTIPDDVSNQVRVRVRMDNSGTDYEDKSDVDLSIVAAPIPGDMNCDGAFDGADIDPFFFALGDPIAYEEAFPDCAVLNGDMNGDNTLDGADIDPFFVCLGGGICP